MKKDGFVFVETIVVLVVLIGGVVALYSTYSLLASNMERRTYYDNISDLYKTDILRSQIKSGINENVKFIDITKNNCTAYFNYDNCSILMDDIKATHIYITQSRVEDILSGNEIDSYDPSLIEYLKTMHGYDKEKFIIGEYNYNGVNHYGTLIYRRG